jgi:crossover junction endodeoxyribonuclease RuvC
MFPVVLGLDPGFASIGFAKIRLRSTGEEVISMGVIRTTKWKAKSKKKGLKPPKQRKPSASEDNLRRAQEIAARLIEFLNGASEVQVICVEAMSFPRNSSAAAKMAMCWGVIAALAQSLGIPVLQVTPKALKKSVCGKEDAEKIEVQSALDGRYGVSVLQERVKQVPRSLWEHPYDALGAAVACLETDPIKSLPRF